MKKILTLLSAVSLTATASASVVACGEGNDNGGGTVEPPTTEFYKLNEIFVSKEIEEIQVTYNPNGNVTAEKIYQSIITKILELNYNNKESKIKEVESWTRMGNVLGRLTYFYSENGLNENFEKLKEVGVGLPVGENLIENFEFNLDLIHSDIINANKGQSWENSAKNITQKMEQGTVNVIIKKLVIKVIQ
ncbi:lipoprotein [Spiroplasma endosymbiont of Diplazon laetatorius]|uniref:lipoprotein n=1 Tax=Spiroplasma endosymbiont of Diplazon laetatorius TaxID=3066322 RepID=UPI0030CCD7D2